MTHNKPRIAVVGSGISGISAAYYLDSRCEVTLFEANSKLGGHTNTVTVTELGGNTVPIDTGFIVFNTQNYPNFCQFLNDLNVPYVDSDMSFAYYDPTPTFYYSSDIPFGLFAQKCNLFSRRYWRFLKEITGFNAQTLTDLAKGEILPTETLGQYLCRRNVTSYFTQRYVYPMGAAIWSCPVQEIAQYPAKRFFEFWRNHCLLNVNDRPVWKTILGGSKSYIAAFKQAFTGKILTSTPVQSIKRNDNTVTLKSEGKTFEFDKVLIATHADQALKLLADPTDMETALLLPWEYTKNTVYLHTDAAVMPPKKSAWASWCVTRSDSNQLNLSYYMNRLQPLPSKTNYFVTLNEAAHINRDAIIETIHYTHPKYTFESVNTQDKLSGLNQHNTFFCGSYFGFGFHEDGIASSLNAIKQMGV